MRELFRSVSGLSPSAAVRRERLAQRNYIMRATGFLETAPLGAPIGERIGMLVHGGGGEASSMRSSCWRCLFARAVLNVAIEVCAVESRVKMASGCVLGWTFIVWTCDVVL